MNALKMMAAVSCFGPLIALAEPLTGGDVKIGQSLVEKNCSACHARHYPDNADKMYTRANRKVTTRAKLLAQIAFCNTQIGTQWFPEDELHAAAYLNQEHYKFPPEKQ
jgi:Zn-finger protein